MFHQYYFLLFASEGYILAVDTDSITITVNHVITPPKNGSNVTYRIDPDNTLSSFSTPLSNLSKLFSKDSLQDERLRKLIIDKEKPLFNTEVSVNDDVEKIMTPLNGVQRKAIMKCITANDYLLILGMNDLFQLPTQLTFTSPKSTIETLEKGVKYVQS